MTNTKIKTQIKPIADNIALNIGDESQIQYTLSPSDAVGNIIFTSSNPNVVTVDSNGRIKAIAAGTASIAIEFSGSEYYETAKSTVNIAVDKKATKLTASAVTATYNLGKKLVITLKDSNGNALSDKTVTVKLKGTKKYKTNKKGQIKVAVGKLVPKKYTAKISFAGTDLYKESSIRAKVVVKKAKPKITAKAKRYKAKTKVKKYRVTLKANKKAVKGKKITLKVKGKTYKAKTNKKGKATFKIKNLKKKGKYKVVIKFRGNKYYKKAVKKVKIKVK